MKNVLIILLSFLIVTNIGCMGQSDQGEKKNEPPPLTAEILPKINEVGNIPVLEYHRLGDKEERWTRTAENFRKDLEWLALNDYQIISVADYVSGLIPTAPGKKPVMLTFDDSTLEQFRYIKDKDGKWTIDPECMVGIILDVNKKYPELGIGGMFFILPSAFEQPEVAGEKLRQLWDLGFEVGNHTLNHPALADMNAEQIKKELGEATMNYKKLIGDEYFAKHPQIALAYPYGSFPADKSLRQLVKSSVYQGVGHEFKAMFLVGSESDYPPYHKDFRADTISRIQALDSQYGGSEDEWMRHFNRKPGFVGKNPIKENFPVYISDGDPNKITVQTEDDKEVIDVKRIPKGVVVRVISEIK